VRQLLQALRQISLRQTPLRQRRLRRQREVLALCVLRLMAVGFV
jgi:hypothetical protein